MNLRQRRARFINPSIFRCLSGSSPLFARHVLPRTSTSCNSLKKNAERGSDFDQPEAKFKVLLHAARVANKTRTKLLIGAILFANFNSAGAKGLEVPKIVTVRSCSKVGLTGKNLTIGEELSFYKADPDQVLSATENLKETVQIRVDEKRQEGRYWGSFTQIIDDAVCKSWKNARFSQTETLRLRRDLFIFRAGLDAFSTSFQTGGMGIMTANRDQDFPFIYGGSFRFALFPTGSTGHDFVSQSIGFLGEAQFAQGQENWEFDTGESITPKLLIVRGGFLIRPFLLGDRSPSSFLIGAEKFDLSFELQAPGTFGRPPLRKLECTGLALAFSQELLLHELFGVTFAGMASPASSCDTDEITRREATALQEKQQDRGAQPLTLNEIVSEKGLKSSSSYGGRAQLNFILLNSLRFYLGGGFYTFRAQLNRNGKLQELSLNRPEYSLGVETVFR